MPIVLVTFKRNDIQIFIYCNHIAIKNFCTFPTANSIDKLYNSIYMRILNFLNTSHFMENRITDTIENTGNLPK